jgi:hypothetical protein
LDQQPYGNILVYTGALFLRECYVNFAAKLRDSASRANNLSLAFAALGDALTHQHFVVLVGTYLLRLVNKSPATTLARNGKLVTPIDIAGTLFGPSFLSSLEDHEKMTVHLELENRGSALNGKMRKYLANVYIPRHLTSIHAAARRVFHAELDGILEILYRYNNDGAPSDDSDQRDLRELYRTTIKKTLGQFRDLLLATVDYLEKETVKTCTDHCECCPSNQQRQYTEKITRQDAPSSTIAARRRS